MVYVAIFFLLVASFGAVAWPLLGRRVRREGDAEESHPWDDLVSERDTAYQALKELEFEYNLGNLSEADYADLRQRYRIHAADILQKLDLAMAAGNAHLARDGEPAILEGEASEEACPSCGEAVGPGDAFCSLCGARLGERCPECGDPVVEGDRFCAACGAHLEVEV